MVHSVSMFFVFAEINFNTCPDKFLNKNKKTYQNIQKTYQMEFS